MNTFQSYNYINRFCYRQIKILEQEGWSIWFLMPLYFPGYSFPSLGIEDSKGNMGQIGNPICKTRWLKILPARKWINVSPAFQFQDIEWIFHKVQAYCFTLEAMQSGEEGWSAHPCHTLQNWGWLLSFCFYIPCREAHNPWMEDAYTQCLHWVLLQLQHFPKILKKIWDPPLLWIS